MTEPTHQPSTPPAGTKPGETPSAPGTPSQLPADASDNKPAEPIKRRSFVAGEESVRFILPGGNETLDGVVVSRTTRVLAANGMTYDLSDTDFPEAGNDLPQRGSGARADNDLPQSGAQPKK